jgi:hypothetical protein
MTAYAPIGSKGYPKKPQYFKEHKLINDPKI